MINFPRLRRSTLGSVRGFTLIEIVTVLAIIAILVGVGAPSLLGSFRASNLSDAGNQVDNLAVLARQDAETHNVRTALVLVTNDSADASLSGRAISVWEMQSNQSWIQSSKWLFLPASTKAYDDPSATITGFPTPAPVITVEGTIIPAGSYSAFIFNPEGDMYGSSTGTRIASVQYATDPAPVSSINTSLGNYYDLVFSPDTGSVHVARP
jgi:prepilin-type N-terminal cleavage/methylation domain-containing protein